MTEFIIIILIWESLKLTLKQTERKLNIEKHCPLCNSNRFTQREDVREWQVSYWMEEK